MVFHMRLLGRWRRQKLEIKGFGIVAIVNTVNGDVRFSQNWECKVLSSGLRSQRNILPS
jgi:hypothetical protein